MRITGMTHRGRVRQRNEDAIGWDERLGVAVIADGMGGLHGGDVASRDAVRSVLEDLGAQFKANPAEGPCATALVKTVQRANRALWMRHGGRPGELMGTTLVAVASCGPERCLVAHVGDSRAYRLREGHLEQLTTDHSLVQQLVDKGVLAPEEMRSAPNRNVITRALGIEPEVDVTHREVSLRPSDILLLCSDGLWEMLPEQAIAAELRRIEAEGAGAADCVEALVEAANAAGGRDNVSVVLMRA